MHDAPQTRFNHLPESLSMNPLLLVFSHGKESGPWWSEIRAQAQVGTQMLPNTP